MRLTDQAFLHLPCISRDSYLVPTFKMTLWEVWINTSYGELSSILKKHFNSAPWVFVERLNFYMRRQQAGQSILDFIVHLEKKIFKKMKSCKFWNAIKNMPRDLLVARVVDNCIYRHLQSERKLTFPHAREISSCYGKRKQRHRRHGSLYNSKTNVNQVEQPSPIKLCTHAKLKCLE